MVTSTRLPWAKSHHLVVIPVIAFATLGITACGYDPNNPPHWPDTYECEECIHLSASGISPNEVALSWVGYATVNYAVFVDGVFHLATGPDETSVVVSGLTADTRYCFQVTTEYRAPGNSTKVHSTSNIACARTLPAT